MSLDSLAPPADAPTILVVDDEVKIRRSMGRLLERQGYRVLDAGSGEEGLEIAGKHAIDVALVDVRMPGMEGPEVVRRLRQMSPSTEVIVVTGFGAAEIAFRVLREGACDYFEKPITDWQRFFQVIRKAIEIRDLKAENTRLSRERTGDSLENLIGNSPAMRELGALIRQVAPTPVPVLVVGESGSGKERVARAIHAASNRSNGPWVAINCAAIPEELLESELFGYERGGHSTATQSKQGLFEVANGGTLFLDEIGEMPMMMQAKLLRALQEREIMRVGGTQPIAVDSRVVAATNRDLKKEIQAKRFREDLYYRLRVVEVRVPPLRERPEDVRLLAYYFIQKYNQEFGKDVRSIAAPAMAMLMAHDWAENNVRELNHAIQRAIVLCTGDELGPDLFELDPPTDELTHLFGEAMQMSPAPALGAFSIPPELLDMEYQEAKEEVLRSFTALYVQERLRTTGGNITRAAELSGMLRPNFKKLMKRFDVEVEDTAERTIQG